MLRLLINVLVLNLVLWYYNQLNINIWNIFSLMSLFSTHKSVSNMYKQWYNNNFEFYTPIIIFIKQRCFIWIKFCKQAF